MGKLTIEQAKKMMEAAKNAETNPIDDKFYPESKITTADKIDTGKPKKLPSKERYEKYKLENKNNSKNNFKKPLGNPFETFKVKKAKPSELSKGGQIKPVKAGEEIVVGKGSDYIKDLID